MVPHFTHWLKAKRLPTIAEVSELFDRDAFNDWFRSEVKRLHAKQSFTPSDYKRLMALDWVGYVDRALRNAGLRDPDLDPAVHDLIVKIAVRGKLFSIRAPEQLLPRFVVAVRNAAITMGQQRSRKQGRYSATPVEDFDPPESPSSSDVIEQFRAFVLANYGSEVLLVFDHRMAGGDTKNLRSEFGSHYAVKEAVKALKNAAVAFASGDEDLQKQIDAALEGERRTLKRRFTLTR